MATMATSSHINTDNIDITCVDKFLGDDEIGKLFESLSITKRLTLRGNCISNNGANIIADVLARNKTITFLSLEWNQILSTGAISLASALETNDCLSHLDLRNNAIGDDGAIALATSLMRNNSLKTLDLRWNQVLLISINLTLAIYGGYLLIYLSIS